MEGIHDLLFLFFSLVDGASDGQGNRAKPVTIDFKVAAHIDHSEYASGSEHDILVTLKNEHMK